MEELVIYECTILRILRLALFKADTLKYALKDMVESTASMGADDYCLLHFTATGNEYCNRAYEIK